jgi:hypothetical protein
MTGQALSFLRILTVESREGKHRAALITLTDDTLRNLEGRLADLQLAGRIRSWFIASVECSFTFTDLLAWLKSLNGAVPDVRESEAALK